MNAPARAKDVVVASMEDGVATVRMNHPAKRNALGTAMLTGLIEAFRGLKSPRVVILRAGLTDTVWSAGFDITAMADGQDPLAEDGLLHRLFACVRDCPAPVIAMLHGSAWGGACDLALRCDMLIADPSASLAFTPARIGLPYDIDGLANAVRRLGVNLAMEMFATGAAITADRAYRLGLLNHLVPAEGLETFTTAMARQIACNAPLAIAAVKAQLRLLTDAPSAELRAQAARMRDAALTSRDYREGVAAFLERRAPRFSGD
ncbi:MAG TPA: methylmalonyl-CoA decarboxylase [Acetobacteraceae bacterium]|jgi:methylmalonyl-CoA decarboxylase